jgi:glycine/D-amino acid oxidase-like deaminating enzyme
MRPQFDTIVIGKGLVGSAAAKYLATPQHKVALIGPDEPADYHQAVVFANHFDQARVQRIIGADAIWTRLNFEAAQQYAHLQAQSGIHFHQPVGCLYVNPYGKDDYLAHFEAQNEALHLPARGYATAEAIMADFPEFAFPAASQGVLERAPAGFIQPRRLIQAQLEVFAARAGFVFRETVTDVSVSGGGFSVATLEGNTYTAARVLVAAGSFVNYLNLIPQKLALQSKSEVVLLVEIPERDIARFAHLPSLLYEIDNGAVEGIYLTPPLRYPNGHFYLKMGCNVPEDLFFEDLTEVQRWFRHGDDARFAPKLLDAFRALLPNVPVEAYQTKKCLISRTAHGRPYIGETAQPGLFVAGGCNGYSAMCSDAIGRVAAHLVQRGALPEGFAEGAFALRYR